MSISGLEAIWRDLRLAFRTLRHHPRFAIIATLTLPLGVGANVAIYSVVKAVLLNELPYEDPDRLAFVAEVVPDTPDKPDIDYTVVKELARRSRVIKEVASYSDGVGDLMEGKAEVVRSLHVNKNFFATLGVPLMLGRTFNDDEEQPGPNRAVILSYSFWQRRFGGDPSILGRVLRFDDEHPVVIGILPASFEPLLKGNSELLPEVYTPLGLVSNLPCHRCQPVRSVARINSGSSIADARAELGRMFAELRREDPVNHHPEAWVTVVSLRDRLLGRMVVALSTVFVAVGFVLLIAAANVASLALAKALAREKEMAVRVALGATKHRLAAQLMIESVLVSLAAGTVGTATALWGTPVLASVIPPEVPRIGSIKVDGVVLVFALVVSVGTGVLFGLAPALWAFRGDFHQTLQGGRGTGNVPVRRRTLHALVIAEIALAFVLVVGATLVSRSYLELMRVDPGYDPRNVLTLSTRLWSRTYRDPAQAQRYYSEVLDRVRAFPGVRSAAFTSALPMDTPSRVPFHVANEPVTADAAAAMALQYSVTPDYFGVMRIARLRGRLFSNQDTPNTPRVAVVNATLARRAFGSENPLGKQIKLGDRTGPRPWLTIVGVVADVHQEGLDVPPGPQVYVAETQDLTMRFYRLVARTDRDPLAWEKPVTAAFVSVDGDVPIFHVKSLERYLQGTLAERTFAVVLLTLFAALAVVLALAGVYGLISYSTALRVREFGVRLALGAPASAIVATVLRQTMTVAAIGLACGAVLALVLSQLVATLLFGIDSYNPTTYIAVALVVALTALLAGAVPARRAACLDPLTALRDE